MHPVLPSLYGCTFLLPVRQVCELQDMWAAGLQWLPDWQLEILAAGSLVMEGEVVIQKEFEQESGQVAWWSLAERWHNSGEKIERG